MQAHMGSGGAVCTYYYLHDGLGSTIALVDSTGAVKNTYSYDPWGKSTGVTGSVPNPFRYVGAMLDSSTGLYKMGERYYDPSIGRFTQEDPAGGGYGYADGNPINFVDTTGLKPKKGKPKHIHETHELKPDFKGGNADKTAQKFFQKQFKISKEQFSDYIHDIKDVHSIENYTNLAFDKVGNVFVESGNGFYDIEHNLVEEIGHGESEGVGGPGLGGIEYLRPVEE